MHPIIKKVSFVFAISLFFVNNTQAETYHGIDIDAIYTQSDWSNKDTIKETIDDYALLTTYQTELNNCPAKGADISSCYDSVAKKILTAFYVYPEESIKDYQQLKEILNKIYANQFCTNKYTYPSGNLCATESQPDKLKALHFYIQSLIDRCQQTMQSFLPALKNYH